MSLALIVLTRKTLNLNVSLSLQFEASLCYFWSFNLIATRELFVSDYFGADVFSLVQNSITFMTYMTCSPTARKRSRRNQGITSAGRAC